MKSEPKAFASLSSGLLARKGAARPAMRPQGFGQSGAGLEDLGWNDMGFEAPKAAVTQLRDANHDAFGDEIVAGPSRNPLAALTPVQSPVHSQQAEIADRLVASEEYDEDDPVDETAELYEADDAPAPFENDDTPEPYEPDESEQLEEASIGFTDESEAIEIVEPIAAIAPVPVAAVVRRAPVQRSAPGSKAKAAFTLRVDPVRHLKLRLACAVSGRSAQQIVTDALDALLAEMPELEAMAAKVNRKG
ncbi:MAG: hypothetical protein ABIO43_01935 [Sphingomicrobium sp.]